MVVSRVVAAALADGPEEDHPEGDHPEGDRRELVAWVAHERQREVR